MTAVAADVTLRQLTTTVELSNLLGPDHLAEFQTWCSEHSDADGLEAVHWLIDQGWTTRWQGQQLIAGHHSFFLRQYKLVSRLGGGGMGTVFQAIDDKTGRLVAVKVIRKSAMQRANALERFRREVSALGKLRHPNIVAALEAGQLGAYHYLVMEYIEGRDIGYWVNKLKRLPIELACEVARQAALGLDHAHRLGFIHRDIKPSNLIAVKKGSGELDVRILDFGLARSYDGSADEARVTRAGQIVGTVDYLAPEQAQGAKDVDGRADVYSLGVTLFEMVAGRTPFVGDTMMARLVARVTQKPPSLAEFAADAPPLLCAAVAKALALDPKERFATAAEFAEELGRVRTQASKAASASTVEMTTIEGSDEATQVRTPDKSMPAFDDFQQALEDKARRSGDSQQFSLPPWVKQNRYWLVGGTILTVVLLAVGIGLLRSKPNSNATTAVSVANAQPEARRLEREAAQLAEKPDAGRIQKFWKELWSRTGSQTPEELRDVARRLTATAPHPLDATFADAEEQRTVHRSGWVEGLGSAKRTKRLAFSADGRTLASLGENSVVLHDLIANSTEELTHDDLRAPTSLAFNASGDMLAVGLGCGTIQLWEMNGRTHTQCLTGQQGLTSNVAFLADGSGLLSTHKEKQAVVWKLNGKSTTEKSFDLAHAPFALDAVPQGGLFHLGGFDGRTTVFDPERGPIETNAPHRHPIVGAAYTPDAKLAMVLAKEGICWRLDGSTYTQIWTIPAEGNAQWVGAWSSPWFERLVTLSSNGTLQLRSWKTGVVEWQRDVLPKMRIAAALAVTPDGRFAAVLIRDGSIELIKLPAIKA